MTATVGVHFLLEPVPFDSTGIFDRLILSKMFELAPFDSCFDVRLLQHRLLGQRQTKLLELSNFYAFYNGFFDTVNDEAWFKCLQKSNKAANEAVN